MDAEYAAFAMKQDEMGIFRAGGIEVKVLRKCQCLSVDICRRKDERETGMGRVGSEEEVQAYRKSSEKVEHRLGEAFGHLRGGIGRGRRKSARSFIKMILRTGLNDVSLKRLEPSKVAMRIVLSGVEEGGGKVTGVKR